LKPFISQEFADDYPQIFTINIRLPIKAKQMLLFPLTSKENWSEDKILTTFFQQRTSKVIASNCIFFF
jgi:hypothetical protein